MLLFNARPKDFTISIHVADTDANKITFTSSAIEFGLTNYCLLNFITQHR